MVNSRCRRKSYRVSGNHLSSPLPLNNSHVVTTHNNQPIACYFLAGDELQPFPEEWYQHGYIESQQPVTADYVYYDEESYDAGNSNDAWVPRWEDDRMGMMEHPVRGTVAIVMFWG